MRFFLQRTAALALLSPLAELTITAPTLDKRYIEERDGITYSVFEHSATSSKMEYIRNSGICETTPGVNQYSGYLTVGQNMSMWFWFFEARNSPKTAPLATWFNGGPGCSSMIGLFQENGPCHFVNNQKKPTLNPYSFNTYANMLYVDQPIGTGFSYGTDTANSTVAAAPFVWKLIQAFFANFPDYKSRDFGIFTESYGGHYGPEFSDYIEQQNKNINKGFLAADKINLVAVGINNGWFDPTIQEKAYIDYATSNAYRPLINESLANQLYYNYETLCVPALDVCIHTGMNEDCSNAGNTCGESIDVFIYEETDFDTYDIRQPSDDSYPPSTYVNYLQRLDIQKAIGARVTYSECAEDPGYKITDTGDSARSFLEQLTDIVQSSIKVLLWAGDADFICNWVGNYEVAEAIDFADSEMFSSKSLTPYTVNGVEKGTYKTSDNLSFLRVFEAGHEVMYYQPEVALQVFIQTMQGKVISPT